jgi:hypothetical protein
VSLVWRITLKREWKIFGALLYSGSAQQNLADSSNTINAASATKDGNLPMELAHG